MIVPNLHMDNDEYVNIPRSVEDRHYRYKMPVMAIKIEGRGNGVKTKLVNITNIAKALDRDPLYLMKYFGFELGSQISENAGHLINGKQEVSDLNETLDKFIEKYVLCGKCKNPETIILVKKDNLRLKCKACGYLTQCDVSHKISTYIIRSPPPQPEKKKTDKLPDETEVDMFGNAIKSTPVNEDDELENDWAVPTDPESVAKRQFDLRGVGFSVEEDDRLFEVLQKITPTTNPLPLMNEFWNENPTDDEVLDNIESVAVACNWAPDDIIKNVFASQWLPFTRKNAERNAHYLSLFVDSKDKQKHIVSYMEKMAIDSKDFALSFNDILQMYWVERVLDEDIIRKWHAHPNPKVNPKVSQFLRKRAEVVITWLDKSDEESD